MHNTHLRYLHGTEKDYKEFTSVLNEFRECVLSQEDFNFIRGVRDCADIIHTIVAVTDEKIVATGTLIVEPKFIHNGGYVGHIEDVVVSKNYRGRGIGKKLIEYLMKVAQYSDCYKVILNCSDENKLFYEHCGFKKDGQHMRRDLPNQDLIPYKEF